MRIQSTQSLQMVVRASHWAVWTHDKLTIQQLRMQREHYFTGLNIHLEIIISRWMKSEHFIYCPAFNALGKICLCLWGHKKKITFLMKKNPSSGVNEWEWSLLHPESERSLAERWVEGWAWLPWWRASELEESLWKRVANSVQLRPDTEGKSSGQTFLIWGHKEGKKTAG